MLEEKEREKGFNGLWISGVSRKTSVFIFIFLFFILNIITNLTLFMCGGFIQSLDSFAFSSLLISIFFFFFLNLVNEQNSTSVTEID